MLLLLRGDDADDDDTCCGDDAHDNVNVVVDVPEALRDAYAHALPAVSRALVSPAATTLRARAPIVARACFFSALRMLDGFAEWSDRRVDLCHEYTHSAGVETTTTFLAGAPASARLVVKHARTTVVDTKGLWVSTSCSGTTDVAVDVDALTREHVDDAALPVVVRPDRVRFFKKHQFYLNDSWCFVFIKSWSGGTHQEAERAQSHGQSEFGIEVEYVGTAPVAPSYLTMSLLLKLGSVLGKGGGVMPTVRPRN